MQAGIISSADTAAVVAAHLTGVAVKAIVLARLLRRHLLRYVNFTFYAGHPGKSHSAIPSGAITKVHYDYRY